MYLRTYSVDYVDTESAWLRDCSIIQFTLTVYCSGNHGHVSQQNNESHQAMENRISNT